MGSRRLGEGNQGGGSKVRCSDEQAPRRIHALAERYAESRASRGSPARFARSGGRADDGGPQTELAHGALLFRGLRLDLCARTDTGFRGLRESETGERGVRNVCGRSRARTDQTLQARAALE